MTQTMREQLQELVDRWHTRGIPSILWVLAELKRILAAEQPAVTVRAGWVCKDSHGLCFSKARPDWVHYGMWVSGTVDQRLFNVGWLITDPWPNKPNGGPECILEVK